MGLTMITMSPVASMVIMGTRFADAAEHGIMPALPPAN